MQPKFRFSSSVIRNDVVIREFTDLIDVRCNEGYVVFIKEDGVSGEIYLPLPGERITVNGERVDDDVSCQ